MVKMGREVRVEIGGFGLSFCSFSFSSLVSGFSEEAKVTPDFPEATVVGLGTPVMVGAGSSRPSAALRESWRAKSEACHHSRNFRAKMDVGSKIFKLERRRGYIVCVSVLGLRRD